MYDVFAEYEREKAEQAARRRSKSTEIQHEENENKKDERRKKVVRIWNRYVVPVINAIATSLGLWLMIVLIILVMGGLGFN